MIRVPEEVAGTRLDRFLVSRAPALSRGRLQKLIQEGAVLVNGRVSRASHPLRPGDEVRLPAVSADPGSREREAGALRAPRPEPIPLDVVYEDDHLLVVNKPAGLVVHPSATSRDGTLVNALLARGGPLSGVGGPERPGILHRLDKGTSGLLLVARRDDAHLALAEALRERRIHRRYWALVWGEMPLAEGTISAGIARDERRRTRMSVSATGRAATTHYRVRRVHRWASELALTLDTGRTHQIRVHLAARRRPVFGDETYGGRRVPASLAARDAREARRLLEELHRPALHAAELEFEHPADGRPMLFRAPLPEELTRLVRALEEGDAR